MIKMNLPDPVGECKYCGINLYPSAEGPKPVKFPCGIRREIGDTDNKEKKVKIDFHCPWETKEEQTKIDVTKFEELFSGDNNWE